MTRTESAGAGERLEIPYSRALVLVSAVFVAIVFVWLLYWTVLGLASGHIVLMLVGAGAGIVGIPMVMAAAVPVLRALQHRGPVLIMDEDGVTDIRKKASFIPWSNVGKIGLGIGETASFLCFEFRRPDRERQDLPVLGPMGVLFNRVRALSDWNVSLRLLACRKGRTLTAARRLHARSVRKLVRERNKPATDGWSGTL